MSEIKNMRVVAGIVLSLMLITFIAACERGKSPGTGAASKPEEQVVLVFPYGSEKAEWIKNVTTAFNQNKVKTASGKAIFVEEHPMGSGESIEEILAGTIKAHIVSPASASFIKLGNAKARVQSGKDLIGQTENLVLSPVVIAMWKPLAEAIGWGKKPVGWSDIIAIAQNPEGWAAYGYPQWGAFKLGHTHPEYSNSGLMSIFAEVYASANKTSGLTLTDIQNQEVAKYIGNIERAIVHYGRSTGFFGDKMFSLGPSYLSAAVLYESMVINSYSGNKPLQYPVVAIYPKEGTFWSDHPIGIVDREWVTDEHKEAAKIYIDYLLAKPQQEIAMQYGFRPGNVEIPLAAPIDAAHGVNPKEPETVLEVPSTDVMDAIIKLWHTNKKHSNVVLVLDTSGSMEKEGRMENAKLGAKEFINMLGDDDYFTFMTFNSRYYWTVKNVQMKNKRDEAVKIVDSLFPAGGTALYDSVEAAFAFLSGNYKANEDKITAVVVLTDGEDTSSKQTLSTLMSKLNMSEEAKPIRIFTIAYGSEANKDVLKSIADATTGKFYEGKPENIKDVFREISLFF